MQHYTLTRHSDGAEIFAGRYESFSTCIEDAIRENINLSYIDLRNKNLMNLDMDGAVLIGASFNGSNLNGCNMSETNLSQSQFYGCTLYSTCFSDSLLKNCDFRGADFGATLINGTDISDCIFSTLSCFDLDFSHVKKMDGCVFTTPDNTIHPMSKHPIVLKGIFNAPIVILDNSIKIGFETFSKSIIPTLSKVIERKIISNS